LQKVDLVFILGSQIKRVVDGKIILAPHTELKAMAAALYYKHHYSCKFVIMGGYNFGVRYDDENILKANFSFEAISSARNKSSEAEAIKDYMVAEGVSEKDIMLEELSATTEEQVKIFSMLLKRTTFAGCNTVGIMSVANHLHVNFPLFLREATSVDLVPIYAEDVLNNAGKGGWVWTYYDDLLKRNPKAVNFSLEQFRENLHTYKSIAEIIHQWEYFKEPVLMVESQKIVYKETRICKICKKKEFV